MDVQVVNHTMLRLNIGERTALNRNVKIIHTLAPHESFCLSACRSEPGLICFQPAGEPLRTAPSLCFLEDPHHLLVVQKGVLSALLKVMHMQCTDVCTLDAVSEICDAVPPL